jgi:hypothetical protein
LFVPARKRGRRLVANEGVAGALVPPAEQEGPQRPRDQQLVQPAQQPLARGLAALGREVEQRAAFDRELAGGEELDDRPEPGPPQHARDRVGAADRERHAVGRGLWAERHGGAVPEAYRQVRLQLAADMREQPAEALDTGIRHELT